MKYLIVTILTLFFSITAQAIQKIRVKDGGTYPIKISANDMTRITMAGLGRIDTYRGKFNLLDIKPDPDNGDLYITPKPQTAGGAMSFFVTDDNGYVYTLVATQHDIPSETVLLEPSRNRVSSLGGGVYKNGSYMKHVKNLIKAMALKEEYLGYEIRNIDQSVPLWKETDIVFLNEYVGDRFNGDIYIVKNISGETMVLDEREFSEFGKDVKAVSIDIQTLAPNQSTAVYIVRGITYDQ